MLIMNNFHVEKQTNGQSITNYIFREIGMKGKFYNNLPYQYFVKNQ